MKKKKKAKVISIELPFKVTFSAQSSLPDFFSVNWGKGKNVFFFFFQICFEVDLKSERAVSRDLWQQFLEVLR